MLLVIFIRASENSMCCMLSQVSKRPVALLGSVTTNEPVINSPVQLSFRLVDTITNQQITDIQWRVGISLTNQQNTFSAGWVLSLSNQQIRHSVEVGYFSD